MLLQSYLFPIPLGILSYKSKEALRSRSHRKPRIADGMLVAGLVVSRSGRLGEVDMGGGQSPESCGCGSLGDVGYELPRLWPTMISFVALGRGSRQRDSRFVY
jgi:hypothetical protein